MNVNKPIPNLRISLIGMMGAGKSSIAQHLAKKLNITLYDLDHYIEKHTQLSISQIFTQYNELYFRNLEKKYLKQIINLKENFVLSCGGGSFITEDIRNILLNNTIVFWLDASPKIIYSRIKDDNNRPLLSKNNSIDNIEKILKERIQYYQLSHHKINTDNKDITELCNNIIKKLPHENS